MGCDIHGWVEVYTEGKWVAVKELKDRSRNYARFTALAGVRGHSSSPAVPLGIPEDVSETSSYHLAEWGAGGHSHSYLPIVEAGKIFLETACDVNAYDREYPSSSFFDFYDDEIDLDNVRLVFWFDN